MQSVTHRTNVYQRTWQERTNTVQLNSEAALNFAVDNTGNSFSIFVSFFQRDPGFVTFSFLTGQQSFTEAVFYCVQSNVNFVTYLDFQLALGVFELLSRDGGLRFQTSVNQYYVFVDGFQGLLMILQRVEQKIQSCLIFRFIFNVHLAPCRMGLFNIPAVIPLQRGYCKFGRLCESQFLARVL